MQKFDFENLFNKFEANMSAISNLLKKEGRLAHDQIEEINNIYLKRNDDIDLLVKWMQSSEGEESMLNNTDNIVQKIAKLLDMDKKNLNMLEQRLSELKSNLRDLNNNKSLLIYSKEHPNENRIR